MSILFAIIIFSLLGNGTEAKAASTLTSKISCLNNAGTPTTVVATKTGKQVPIIYWKSTTFSGSGWTPERRCQEVSTRFQTYHEQGKLDYITTGRMNGMPVLCVTSVEGGACEGLLYTLKPGQNATVTLKKLFDIQTKPGTAPLQETTSRIYVDVDSVIMRKSRESTNEFPDSQVEIEPSTGYSLF